MSPLTITIKAWSAWAPGLETPEDWQRWAAGQKAIGGDAMPQVQAIPAMLRRRLSSLGKVALATAMPLLADDTPTPAVLVSRHGDLNRTVTLLSDLARGEELSPTQFSLSVHNAIGGLLSITRKDQSSITALACGCDDVSTALLEAQAILAERGCSQVLCLIYDEPVPEVYRGDEPVLPDHPYAAAFILGKGPASGEDIAVDLRLTAVDTTAAAPASEPQALTLARWLLSGTSELSLPGPRNCWRWSRPQPSQS